MAINKRPKRPGRPRHRGLHKGTAGAIISGMKRRGDFWGEIYKITAKQKEVTKKPITLQAQLRQIKRIQAEKYKPSKRAGRRGVGEKREKLKQLFSFREFTAEKAGPGPHPGLRIPTKIRPSLTTMVQSTAIADAEYDPRTESVRLSFWGYKQRKISGVYIIWDISAEEWNKFKTAGSKGQFVYYNWRNKKPYTKIK